MSFTNVPSEQGPAGSTVQPSLVPPLPPPAPSLFWSWKKKVCVASALIVCGTGLAAQFPPTSTPHDEEESFVAAPVRRETFFSDRSKSVSTNSTDNSNGRQADAAPALSHPQQKYAQDASTTDSSPGFVVAKPEGRIGKYTPPPSFRENVDNSKKTTKNRFMNFQRSNNISTFAKSDFASPTQFDPTQPSLLGTMTEINAKKPQLESFTPIDYSVFKKSELDLSLDRKNPLFDKKPPRSTAAPSVSISMDEIVTSDGKPVERPEAAAMLRDRKVAEEAEFSTLRPPISGLPADSAHVVVDLADIVPAKRAQKRLPLGDGPTVSVDLQELAPSPARKNESKHEPSVVFSRDEIQPAKTQKRRD